MPVVTTCRLPMGASSYQMSQAQFDALQPTAPGNANDKITIDLIMMSVGITDVVGGGSFLSIARFNELNIFFRKL